MYGHTEQVTLGGREYPMRCDINVLIEIQDSFETLENFELKLSGLEVMRDKKGKTVMRDGKIMFRKVEPSYRAVASILPCMLREGQKASGGEGDMAQALGAIDAADFDLTDVVTAMHREYSKCFERKNQPSAKKGKEGTPIG